MDRTFSSVLASLLEDAGIPAHLTSTEGGILVAHASDAARDDHVELTTYRVGRSLVRLSEGVIERNGERITLRPKERSLLRVLLRRANRVVSRADLLREAWGYQPGQQSRTLDTHVLLLRRKLGAEASRLQTVWSRGYLLEAHHIFRG